MKCFIYNLFLLAVCFDAVAVSAQSPNTSSSVPVQRMVVTATRIETPPEEIASSVTVISSEEIEARQQSTVAEVLKSVPGVDVVQSGPTGGNAAVFIRGANSEHTLVLIDGIEANNPINPTRAFNFAEFYTTNIDRIEILRGPQSTLYGSDALGGVINIITKKGIGSPTGYASFDGGSFNTLTEQAGLAGGSQFLNYSLGVSQDDTKGISAADRRAGNFEKDGHDNTTLSTRLGLTPSSGFSADFITRYNNGRADIDNTGGASGDDPNRTLRTEELFVKTAGNTHFFSNRLQQTFGVSYSFQQYSDNNDPDPQNPIDRLRSRFQSERLKFDLQNTLKHNEFATTVLGIETENERGSSNLLSASVFGPFESDFGPRSARTNGYYAEETLHLADHLFVSAGGRLDDHSNFGNRGTWKIAPTALIPEAGTRVFGTIGTGYKSPSLYQLFSEFGNEDLDPEKSLGIDVGVEQSVVKDRVKVGVTYFHNKFDDLISFDPNTNKFFNIARARTEGLESFLDVQSSDTTQVRVDYTLTNARDENAHEELLRRAKHKVGVNLSWKPHEKTTLTGGVQYVGRRIDNDFSTYPAARTSLGGYALVNIAASYDVRKDIQLFARVDNLFNRKYVEVLGYGTPGIAGYGGVKISF